MPWLWWLLWLDWCSVVMATCGPVTRECGWGDAAGWCARGEWGDKVVSEGEVSLMVRPIENGPRTPEGVGQLVELETEFLNYQFEVWPHGVVAHTGLETAVPEERLDSVKGHL